MLSPTFSLDLATKPVMLPALNENRFLSLADAHDKIEQWRDDYNRHRPHISLCDLTPVEFAES
jgi:transposase InsO family protein